jgi:signal peptidase I
MRRWRDYFENILVAIFLALFVRTFILTGYRVPTASMAPTLLPGDFIFSYRLPYGIKVPLTSFKIAISSAKKGEVVVFTFPEQPRVNYVKRVIGLPGDRIEIKDGVLYVNGEQLEYKEKDGPSLENLPGSDSFQMYEEKSPEGIRDIILKKQVSKKSFGPLVVPPNEVFLLGDNRDASDDSRYWGTVPLDRVEGKVLLIWLSLDWNKKLAGRFPSIRNERIFTWVH